MESLTTRTDHVWVKLGRDGHNELRLALDLGNDSVCLLYTSELPTTPYV